MTATDLHAPPPPAPQSSPARRRWWVFALVVAWMAAVTGLSFWSVRRDPPTVQEQRDIAAALPVLDQATGAALAAASAGRDRAAVLGAVRIDAGCSITPVRSGVRAVREVTVYVQAGSALRVLRQIAAALPAGYRAQAGESSGGKRIGLSADAGNFVGIDAAADAGTQVFTLRADTGCRPGPPPAVPPAVTSTGPAPSALDAAVRALGAPASAIPAVRAVTCPSGQVARTYTVDGIGKPADLGGSLQSVIGGATVVRAEPAGWAYRAGTDSVVIVTDGDSLRVSATTSC